MSNQAQGLCSFWRHFWLLFYVHLTGGTYRTKCLKCGEWLQ